MLWNCPKLRERYARRCAYYWEMFRGNKKHTPNKYRELVLALIWDDPYLKRLISQDYKAHFSIPENHQAIRDEFLQKMQQPNVVAKRAAKTKATWTNNRYAMTDKKNTPEIREKTRQTHLNKRELRLAKWKANDPKKYKKAMISLKYTERKREEREQFRNDLMRDFQKLSGIKFPELK